MFSVLTSKILGGLSVGLLIAVAFMGWQISRLKAQRDELIGWKAVVVQATRDASANPKLGEKNVAEQIRYMGAAIEAIRAAQGKAKASALAAKMEQEQRDNQRKERSDDELAAAITEARRRADRHADANRVRKPRRPSPEHRGNDAGTDLPSPAFASGFAEGAGGDAIVVSREDFDTCTDNSVRLKNAVDWATAPAVPRE